MQEIQRLEKEASLEQVQMELADFKNTTATKREEQKGDSINAYKTDKPPTDLNNPFKLTRELMLIEAGYDAADLTYQVSLRCCFDFHTFATDPLFAMLRRHMPALGGKICPIHQAQGSN